MSASVTTTPQVLSSSPLSSGYSVLGGTRLKHLNSLSPTLHDTKGQVSGQDAVTVCGLVLGPSAALLLPLC